MSFRTEFALRLALVSPWAIPGSDVAAYGRDIRQARQADTLCIPASHLKGIMREAAREIAAACPELNINGRKIPALCDWLFGTESPEGTNDPKAGALTFGALLAEDMPAQDGPAQDGPAQDGAAQDGAFAVRVSLDDEGIAEDGQLLMVELPFPRGQTVSFAGKLDLASGDAGEIETARQLLERSLAVLHSLGGMKSSGFGRIANAALGDAKAISAKPVSVNATRLRLTYQIDRPFLVNADQIGTNLSVGNTVIPGGAIKAVLARALGQQGVAFADRLGASHIGHAHPVGQDILPLSLGIADDAPVDGFEDPPPSTRFKPDWKDADITLLRTALGHSHPTLGRFNHTRTAIDPGTYSAKRDDTGGQLFSQVAVDPGQTRWSGVVDFKDADFAATVLSLLNAGCVGLGKTGARITLGDTGTVPPVMPTTGRVAVHLTSEAVLLPQSGAVGRSVFPAYKAYFAEHGLTLRRHFASHALRGGYLAQRYRVSGDRYQPWLTTQPGSAFLFELPDDRSCQALGKLLDEGLPPSHDNARDWRRFPFMRENGFGAITLTPPLPSAGPSS